jgi:hypothetical protein
VPEAKGKGKGKGGGSQSGGTITDNIKNLQELEGLLGELDADCKGGSPYGVKLGESINVIRQIIKGKLAEQNAAKKAVGTTDEKPEKKEEKKEATAEDIGETINKLKALKDAIEKKKKSCQGGNLYAIKLAQAVNEIEEIIVMKIHEQEAAGQRIKEKKVEDETEPGHCEGRFSEGEQGGKKTRKRKHKRTKHNSKHKRSKHKHSKHKRSNHKRSNHKHKA